MKLVRRKRLILMSLMLILVEKSGAQDLVAPTIESLDSQFVQIETADKTPLSVSALDTLQTWAEVLQTRTYSLLNWKLHRRNGELQIENYNRKEHFGRWVNDPNDDVCFNTRAKVLSRDSQRAVVFKEANHCVVDQGRWLDPYTNTKMISSSDIQIDHLVPLKNAYVSGAYNWTFRARCLYANYMGYDFHLLSVSGHENMKKGDSAPDEYMPPNPDYACTYVRNWLAVKMLWKLSMPVNEANAIHQIIVDNHCSLTDMRVTEGEVNRQRKYAQENQDLCEKMDHAQ